MRYFLAFAAVCLCIFVTQVANRLTSDPTASLTSPVVASRNAAGPPPTRKYLPPEAISVGAPGRRTRITISSGGGVEQRFDEPPISRTTVADVPAPSRYGNRSVTIPRGPGGHFWTEGQIDGQRMRFVIDTGASVVALTEKSAASFGWRPSSSQYTMTVNTANGKVKVARTRLPMIDIGGIIERDVDAVVHPDGTLSENLLGLSFLNKLKRFEYADGRMVLEQ